MFAIFSSSLALLAQAPVKAFFLFDRDLFARGELAFAADRIGLPLFNQVDLLFEVFFFLGEPPFLVLDLLPFLAVFLLELRAGLVELVLGLEDGLFAFGLGLALGVRNDPRRLAFGVPDLARCGLSFDQQAQAESSGQSRHH